MALTCVARGIPKVRERLAARAPWAHDPERIDSRNERMGAAIGGLGRGQRTCALVAGAGWVARLPKRRKRRALALLVCPVLDRFVADCQAAIDDDGKWHTSGTRYFGVQTPTGPEFPTEVDWASIGPELADRILALPLATLRADQELDRLGIL